MTPSPPLPNNRAKAREEFLTAASSPAAIRARISLLASERALPSADVDKATSRLSRDDCYLIDFALAYDVSFDWLMLGDLRGLKRMRRVALSGNSASSDY